MKQYVNIRTSFPQSQFIRTKAITIEGKFPSTFHRLVEGY